MAAWMRNPTGFIKLDPKSLDAFKAGLFADHKRGLIDDDDLNAGIARIAAAQQKIAYEQNTGAGQARREQNPPKPTAKERITDKGISRTETKLQINPETGKPEWVEQTKFLQNPDMPQGGNVAQPVKKAPPAQKPLRPRYHFETNAENQRVRINNDDVNDTAVVPNFTPKPTGGGKKINIGDDIKQFLTGGGSSNPSPKVQVGQTVTLKNGTKVTVKKVNPDGTFVY